jgi:hypothetical protein
MGILVEADLKKDSNKSSDSKIKIVLNKNIIFTAYNTNFPTTFVLRTATYKY